MPNSLTPLPPCRRAQGPSETSGGYHGFGLGVGAVTLTLGYPGLGLGLNPYLKTKHCACLNKPQLEPEMSVSINCNSSNHSSRQV